MKVSSHGQLLRVGGCQREHCLLCGRRQGAHQLMVWICVQSVGVRVSGEQSRLLLIP